MFNIAFFLFGLFFLVSIYQFKKIKYIGKKSYIWLLLRCIMIFTAATMLLFPTISFHDDKVENILLIDDSKSMNIYKDDINRRIKEFNDEHKGEEVFIYYFSGIPHGENNNSESDYTDLSQGFKNIYFDKGDKNLSITIFSDGLITENIPDISEIPKNWEINTVPFYGKERNDIAFKEFRVSKISSDRDQIITEVEAIIDSTINCKATLTIENNERILLTKDIDIVKGTEKFKIPWEIKLNDSTVMGRISSNEDLNSQNDFKKLEYLESDEMMYLVISDDYKYNEIKSVLDMMGISEYFINTRNVSSSSLENYDFDGIILNNCDGKNFTDEGIEYLKNLVGKEGKGCFVIGGENSFGLGGYRENGLEELMPVEDKPSGAREESDSAIVIVLDTSGSMDDSSGGIKKINLAKSGLNSVINQLSNDDYFGVIGFSDTYEWVQPLASVDELNLEDKDFITLGAKGGTLIKPAIVQGYIALKEEPLEKNKHILLISDGQGDTGDYDDLTQKLLSSEITLSAIGIGEKIESEFLHEISEKTNGEYYEIKNLNDLPQIMVRDIYKNGKKLLQSGRYKLKEFKGNTFINNYVAVTPKKESEVIISNEEGDPILCTWKFGMGNVCALMTKIDNSWSGNLVGSDFLEELYTIFYELPLKENSSKIVCKIDGNRIEVYSEYSDSNISKLDILHEGRVIYTEEYPFKIHKKISYGTFGKTGRYRINGYDETGDVIFLKNIWIDYSSENNLFQKPEWTNNAGVFFKKNSLNSYKDIKTIYLGWPILTILFIILVYMRKKY